MISKGLEPLLGLKVWLPAPDQLPSKLNTASASNPPTATSPPTVQAIEDGLEFASPLHIRIATKPSQPVPAIDFSVAAKKPPAGNLADNSLSVLDTSMPSGNEQLAKRIPVFLSFVQPGQPNWSS